MHELSVTESILNICVSHAQKAGADRVTDVHIVIGKLSSIVDDSVQFYWDILCQNTLCQGSVLHFQRMPARLKCSDCGLEYEIERELLPCPACQSYNIKVLSGDQFWVDSIEIEQNQG